MNKDIVRIIGGMLVLILLIDVFCFLLWIGSGQVPADNFYMGTLTAHMLQFIIE